MNEVTVKRFIVQRWAIISDTGHGEDFLEGRRQVSVVRFGGF